MSTSRLKRKAQDDPDLLGDSNLLENFVSYGTALPSLTSTKRDQGEYVPVWKQEVRDEKGRRRLHGAFTGGFSAGYFNTVGSKEGWAPSTFVSSKDAKSAGRAGASARPEDFMDEEDLAEIKAARSFKTSDQYANVPQSTSASASGLQGQDQGKDANYSSAIANAMQDLVKPGTSKIGEKIMMKMGWRPGQGVGPRVSYARRKQQIQELGLQRSFGDDGDEEEEENEEAKKHLYAPVDRPLLLFEPKENTWGLGYQAVKSLLQEMGDASTSSLSDRKGKARQSEVQIGGKSMPVGGAFGISALEDADEDDEDVYSSVMKGKGSLELHDDEDEEDMNSLGGQRRPQLMQRQQDARKAALQTRTKPPIQQEASQRFSDGTSVIRGFRLASKAQIPEDSFPSVDVPEGWQPNPQAVWDRYKLKPQSQSAPSTASGAALVQEKGKQNMLTADDRASILGEPVAPKSVFEFMSAKNRERLQNLANAKDQTNALGSEGSPQSDMPDEQLQIPTLEARVAQGALRGFMPYGDDLAKQARYKAYLNHFAAPSAPGSEHFKPRPLPGKKIADLNKELGDFANAAAIFKPMTGMMANRFTSGTSSATLLDIKVPDAGLRVPEPKARQADQSESASKSQKEAEEREKDDKDPRRMAVRAGMYGRLTRSTESWYPARLLCKRFNVADPHPDGPSATDTLFENSKRADGNVPPEKDVLNQDTMNDILREGAMNKSDFNAPKEYEGAATAGENGEVHAPRDLPIPSVANVGLGEDETQGRDTLTYTKPPMDIFKAIFADSDDEDEDDSAATGVGNTAAGVSDAMEIDDPSALPSGDIFAPAKQEEPSIPVTMDNVTSFKPTFVSKTERATTNVEKKDKEKKKKKKAAAAALSFNVEEDGEAPAVPKDKASKKSKGEGNSKDKKARKDKSNGDVGPKQAPIVEEEDEWVEKEQVLPASLPDVSINARKSGRVRASELF